MSRLNPLGGCLLLAGIVLVSASCQRLQRVERTLTSPDSTARLDRDAPFLKAHMRDGTVYVLSEWSVGDEEQVVRGQGVRLDVRRDTLDQGRFAVAVDSVAIFETNVLKSSGAVAALAVVTGLSVGLTVYCAANPKACFGSCPTFYAPAGDSLVLQAEGFSSSIAPSLEARDVDALYRARPAGPAFTVEMRNEALETHVVRYADLLLAPRPDDGRVLVDLDGEFVQVRSVRALRSCRAPEGDCLPAVAAVDGVERFSPADASDLATREVVELTFEASPDEPVGLVIGARQTLLTTFLLYQTLAYMGRDVGRWLALLERNDARVEGLGLGHVLGGIEVLVQDGTGRWTPVGEVREHGPLAVDVHLVPLPRASAGANRIRLRLTRGNWRIDYLALARLGDRVEPLRVRPAAVLRDGVPDERARSLLHDPAAALTTLPGDAYTLVYPLPEAAASYEAFLESRGYYLEWIRREWMEEEDPERLKELLFTPRAAMRTLAPAFKHVEPEMEAAFWRSRYVRQ